MIKGCWCEKVMWGVGGGSENDPLHHHEDGIVLPLKAAGGGSCPITQDSLWDLWSAAASGSVVQLN